MLTRSNLPLAGQEVTILLRSGRQASGKVLESFATALILEGDDRTLITLDPAAIDGWFREVSETVDAPPETETEKSD